MLLEVEARQESFVAEVACEGLLASVEEIVHPEVVFFSEAFAADIAGEGF